MLRFTLLSIISFISFIVSAQNAVSQSPSAEIYGRTTGVLPYLEYSLGSDRLGAAKITYLDTGVLVKITDSTLVNYKIRLSAHHEAYLPKEFLQKADSIQLPAYFLSGSWKVWGDSAYDYVSVSLDEKLPYRSVQQINPARIVVDLYGLSNNTNWITQLSSAIEIKNVFHEQVEDDVFRVTIELKHNRHWGYKIYYIGNRLMVRVKRQPPVLSLKNLKIAVDAGHGGSNKGATGKTSGIMEKNYTLLIAKELQQVLKEENATVLMTRETDTTLGMNERILALQAADPDFLISIHLNSSSKDSIRGTSTYYRYIGFRPLSYQIYKSMLKLGIPEFGNIGNFNFALNGPVDYPNALVEVAFLSNKEDEQLILDPVFRRRVAEQIKEGILNWLKECGEGAE